MICRFKNNYNGDELEIIGVKVPILRMEEILEVYVLPKWRET